MWTTIVATVSTALIVAGDGWSIYQNDTWLSFYGPIVAADLFAAIAAASFLVWLPEIGTRVLSTPFLVAIGSFSYSLYLIHYPLWLACRAQGVPGFRVRCRDPTVRFRVLRRRRAAVYAQQAVAVAKEPPPNS